MLSIAGMLVPIDAKAELPNTPVNKKIPEIVENVKTIDLEQLKSVYVVVYNHVGERYGGLNANK